MVKCWLRAEGFGPFALLINFPTQQGRPYHKDLVLYTSFFLNFSFYPECMLNFSKILHIFLGIPNILQPIPNFTKGIKMSTQMLTKDFLEFYSKQEYK